MQLLLTWLHSADNMPRLAGITCKLIELAVVAKAGHCAFHQSSHPSSLHTLTCSAVNDETVQFSEYGSSIKTQSAVQIHFPFPFFRPKTLADGLQEAIDLGLATAVGVCNHNTSQLEEMHGLLDRKGISLATNQVFAAPSAFSFLPLFLFFCVKGATAAACHPWAFGSCALPLWKEAAYSSEGFPRGFCGLPAALQLQRFP